MVLLVVSFLFVFPGMKRTEARQCKNEDITFELMTGYVYSAPDYIMDTKSEVLQLSECIENCRLNSSCHAVNFETGLCILFSGGSVSSTGVLTKSQFPVFTLFAQKVCVHESRYCNRPWLFEVVRNHALKTLVKHQQRVATRQECMELCLQERVFTCRSANYDKETGNCAMSDMDRFTTSGQNSLTEEEGIEYIESNCVSDPINMCGFVEFFGNILKTVDAIHQDVESVEACHQLCLQNNQFRCHTYDYGDAGPQVCRLSHHATQSLNHIEEPYMDLEQSTTYQITSCYNVTIDCRATDMVARIQTNKIFSGKVYAKNRPNSCVNDVTNSLEFDLHLGYHDINCDVKQDITGKFSTDIIIQHHDHIVTSQDVGLSVRCSYNMQNHSIGHGVKLEVSGELESSDNEENAYVVSPTVTMRITDRNGDDVHTAQVGDALSLRFDILDTNSPYQIFVRELIAMDGIDSSEILLIDSLGCPTDPTIMGPISAIDTIKAAKILQAPFDAFKFPTSDVVQFKALVTPCLPSCEPTTCAIEDYYGMLRHVNSFGRRKREIDLPSVINNTQKGMVVGQIIHISDKFENLKHKSSQTTEKNQINDNQLPCFSNFEFSVGIAVFITLQFLMILAWIFVLYYQCHSRKQASSNCQKNIQQTCSS